MIDMEPDYEEKEDRPSADLHAVLALQLAADDFNRIEHVKMAGHRQAILDLLLR